MIQLLIQNLKKKLILLSKGPSRSTLQHLRIPFSIFLLPIPLFTLAEIPDGNLSRWMVLIGILSLGIFPASNAYNSYYDRDESSIGGLRNPPPVSQDLLLWSLSIEGLALILALIFLGFNFFLLLFVYGGVSKLYSHPSVRWKARPWAGWLAVVMFQGCLIYCLCRLALTGDEEFASGALLQMSSLLGALVSALLVGASYPLTQIYQHREDEKRGDFTLSRKLGIRGTFIFSFALLGLALPLLAMQLGFGIKFLFVGLASLPGFIYLIFWARHSWNDFRMANFSNAHRFLLLSSMGGILGFLMAFAASAEPLAPIPSAQGTLLPAKVNKVSDSQVQNQETEEVLLEQGFSSVKAVDGRPWFKLSKFLRKQGKSDHYRVSFEDSSGKQLSEEKLEYVDGRFSSYHWKSYQTQQEAEIRLLGKTLNYSYADNGFEQGKKKESSSELSETEIQQLVMPPMVSQHILANWDLLQSGKSIDLQIAAPDLRTRFSFTIAKTDRSPQQEIDSKIPRSLHHFNFRANNAFVRWKLGVIPFVFDGNKNLIEVRDFLPPVRWENKKRELEEKTSDWKSSISSQSDAISDFALTK